MWPGNGYKSDLKMYCVVYKPCRLPPSQTSKAQAPASPEVASRLKCAGGLAEMENRNYKNAGRLFIQASFEHCKFPDVS